VSMNEHALAGGEEVEQFMNPVQVRLSGEPAVVSAEVLLRSGERLVYGTYRTTSLPGACRQALREYPGAELLQVRRLVEAGEGKGEVGTLNSEL
jgi:hypothetical protein